MFLTSNDSVSLSWTATVAASHVNNEPDRPRPYPTGGACDVKDLSTVRVQRRLPHVRFNHDHGSFAAWLSVSLEWLDGRVLTRG